MVGEILLPLTLAHRGAAQNLQRERALSGSCASGCFLGAVRSGCSLRTNGVTMGEVRVGSWCRYVVPSIAARLRLFPTRIPGVYSQQEFLGFIPFKGNSWGLFP